MIEYVQILRPSSPSRFMISSGGMKGRSFSAIRLDKIGYPLSSSCASLAGLTLFL